MTATTARDAEEPPTLTRLAETRATGALFSDVGAVYVRDGQVVHAESPATPTVEELLAGVGRLSTDAWRTAVRRGGRRGQVARALLDSGQLARGELEICHLGALYDAAYFALAPDSGRVRFRAGAGHWLGVIRPVPAGAVARELGRRRRLLDTPCSGPARPYDAPVRPTRAADPVRRGGGTRSAGLPMVPPRRLPVLVVADGTRTATDIARLLGRPTFHVLLDVRRLATDGYLEASVASVPDDARTNRAVLPYRVREAAAAAEPPASAEAASGPDIALLRRLRDALEEKL